MGTLTRQLRRARLEIKWASEIPPITDELGKYWKQPDRENIDLSSGTEAFMSEKDFKKLAEYSSSIPTGIYEGKMWKRRYNRRWYLCWTTNCFIKNSCAIQIRPIRIKIK